MTREPSLLNEVLSLNAQEYCLQLLVLRKWTVLNEVLSLNAQELAYPMRQYTSNGLLNEVLSLNAQECHRRPRSVRTRSGRPQ